MKKVKVIFGTALMVLAVAGAFASSKHRAVSIFYLDNTGNCVAGEVDEACPTTGTPDCVKPILFQTFSKQIYATQTPVSGQEGRFTCSDAYKPL